MSNLFDENGHLSQSAIQAFKRGTLSKDEMLLMTEHLAECEGCANAFAGSFTADELAEAPSGFADRVVNKLYPKKNGRRQFASYSIRVTVAACAALAIVFSGAVNFISDMDVRTLNIKPPDLYVVDTINSSLQNFSEKLLEVVAKRKIYYLNSIQMEVFQNEKEKK